MQQIKADKNNWGEITLLWLVAVSIAGSFMRWMVLVPTGLNFKYILHAHSHIAFLGWVFTALFCLLIKLFLSPEQSKSCTYQRLFFLFQFTTIGMFISFIFKGYAFFSISFSTIHILLSFFFYWKFLADLKQRYLKQKDLLSIRFIRVALFFMVLSSLGPFSLGPIMAKAGQGSHLYTNAIYFYLHFQYNGWFTFAILGSFFRVIEKAKISFNRKSANYFFYLLFLSCIPAYCLSILWSQPPNWVYMIALISALIQIVAIGILIKIILDVRKELDFLFKGSVQILLALSLIALSLKIILQLLSAFPVFADMAYQIREFIIAYLHLVLIGFVSIYLLALMIHCQMLILSKTGIILLVIGFILTESMIVCQGFLFLNNKGIFPNYYILLFILSLVILIGSLFLLRAQLIKPKT